MLAGAIPVDGPELASSGGVDVGDIRSPYSEIYLSRLAPPTRLPIEPC